MLTVSRYGEIELTRGDTARLSVLLTDEETGAPFEAENGDKLMFTIRKTATDAKPLVQLKIEPDEVFHIRPEHTQGCEFGKYLYDVQLTTAQGDIYTVIEPTTFKIAKEVGY